MEGDDSRFQNSAREPFGNGDGQEEAKFSPASSASPRPGFPVGAGPAPPSRQLSGPSLDGGEPSPYKRAPPPPERPYADGPPTKRPYEGDGPAPYEGGARGGYRGRGSYHDAGGPPSAPSDYDTPGGYRGRGGRGGYSGPPEGGPPERFPPVSPSEDGDRPNIAVYPPRDADDAKPSFEVYPPREGSSGPPSRPGPPIDDVPPPAGDTYDTRGRGYYRGRQPFYRGRGRGYSDYGQDDGYDAGRGRGWVDRGRGYVDRGRGYVDRGRGWVDRGRGEYRGRGWVDRGRGRGWVDRGRGGWVDRGRGGWVDRGRGGWVDRGRGGWVDRGGRGGWVDRGRGGFDRGRGRGRGNIEFDKTGEYMWDEKNSCWKKVPQHWKQQMQENPGKPPYEGEGRGAPMYRDAGDWGGAGRGGPPRSDWGGGGGGPPPEQGGPWGGRPGEGAAPPQGGEQVWEEDGWVWDEREQAWRTRRPDGSWEWEWEYEAREAAQGGRHPGKSNSASPTWRGDYKPQVDETGRELPRAYAPVGAPPEQSDDDSSDSDTDSSSDSGLERHRAAEKALLKYKKASRKSRAFAEEIDKHRKKLMKVEEKLRKHKERKKKKKKRGSGRGAGGPSPPHAYRHGAEEGECAFSDDDDATSGGAERELPREPSDIFHGPSLKHRDKRAVHGPDPGGGDAESSEGFRDVDYRLPKHNPYGDQDERRGAQPEWQQPQEAQTQAPPQQQWKQRGGRGGGAGNASGRHAAPLAQALQAQDQPPQQDFVQEAPPPREGGGQYERERLRRPQQQQGIGPWHQGGPAPAPPVGGWGDAAPRDRSGWGAPPPPASPHAPPQQWGNQPAPPPYNTVAGGPEPTPPTAQFRGGGDSWGPPPQSRSFKAPPPPAPQQQAQPPPPSGSTSPWHAPTPPPSPHGGRGRGRGNWTPSDPYRPPSRGGSYPDQYGGGGSRDREFDEMSGYESGSSSASTQSRGRGRGGRNDAFNDPRRENLWKPQSNTSYGNNSDYTEYADAFGLEEVAFREASLEPAWLRSTPADLYFKRDKETNNMMSTNKMHDIEDYFEQNIVLRSTAVRESQPKYEKPCRNKPVILHSFSDSESEASDEEVVEELNKEMVDEIERKRNHPERLHEELWFNEEGESNTGPYCRCSLKAQRSGIRHGIYPGDTPFPICDPASNNWDKLFHYRLSVSPVTNFLLKDPTVIEYDKHEYIFEGFSLLSHYRIGKNVPQCKVVRFNIEYTLHWIEEDPPQNYDIRSIDLFNDFLMEEILELYDLNLRDDDGGCRKFHFMPRYARPLPDNGKEILSMNVVLSHLIKASKPLITKEELARLVDHTPHQWADYVDTVRGSVITFPGKRPSSLRVDQLDKEGLTHDHLVMPKVVHFGMKPSRITYVGNPEYNKLWKQFVKFRHLLTYKPKVTAEDRQKVKSKEDQLQNLRLKKSMKREVTVALESEGWLKTGFNSDVCQHALMLPVLISHLRFHKCLDHLETKLRYTFKNRQLLQFALTHPSYRYGTVNYGTNPDHARNSMFNCGMRCPEFGNKSDWMKVHRKRGINVLIKIMAKMAKKEEQASVIDNYERLEFLGDAVVEFITTVHLYFMLPDSPEGVLATYRSAIVQNQHLTELARNLNLQDYFLFAHGPDLCHESEIRHALANCFEALMGALFMDCGVELADRIFGEAFFKGQPELLETWHHMPLHPLQEDEPGGDRHWIGKSPPLQKLLEFEKETGIEFDHIRLLARAFTIRNVGYTTLTLGHNQRMEFLGDSVMQLVVSEYVFKHFPDHHEGHLSLLRQCLVNNKTQCLVCEDLAMEQYMITTSQRRPHELANMKTKEKADLMEAFIGALYVDKGVEWVRVFLRVCFFPRLKEFIMLGDWNDPKSRLQQCCLLRRDPGEQTPEMPKYKVLESKGPTNTRVYRVAVYFKGNRLADAEGSGIQQAEMRAAQAALSRKEELFPLLKYHKSFLQSKFKAFKGAEFSETDFFEEKIPEDQIVPFKPSVKSETAEDKPEKAEEKMDISETNVQSENKADGSETVGVEAEESEEAKQKGFLTITNVGGTFG